MSTDISTTDDPTDEATDGEPTGPGGPDDPGSGGTILAEGPPVTDRAVFAVAAALTLTFVAWGAFARKSLSTAAEVALDWTMRNLGWAFVIAASGFVVFALWLAVSRYGKITLGRDGEQPEFRTSSWVAMMFSAGMGIGLMFYGASEPLTHFAKPPPGTVPRQSPEAIETALATTLFHWTVHPWAIYAVVGLAIGYSTFRKGRRQLISSAFTPLLGKRTSNGPIGRFIDVLAIFATLFGSAASLGLGTLQIRSGLHELEWVDNLSNPLLVLIIAILTAAFVVSAVSGVARGIQYLSNINMVLAAVLAVFVFVVGPTVLILNLLPTAIGGYFRDLAEMSARTAATGGDAMATWLSGATIFYWAWWISWTPFVGMFVARISRGRTIRQFVAGVIGVPSIVSLFWFAIFGGAAISIQDRNINIWGNADTREEVHLFNTLGELPLAAIASVIVVILVAIFFVSGADAASIVMGTLSQRGAVEPRKWIVIFWGAVMGAVATIMLLVGKESALEGLKNITILVAVPFTAVMAVLCVSLAKDLRRDPLMIREEKGIEVVEQAVSYGKRRFGEEFLLQVFSPRRNAGRGTPGPDGDGHRKDE